MKKIEQFQITGMTLSGFKSYQEPTELTFGKDQHCGRHRLRRNGPALFR